MGQINTTPENAQGETEQLFAQKIAMWITGVLWFMLFSSVLLSRFTSFNSGFLIVPGIGILAIGILFHGKRVLDLSLAASHNRPATFDSGRAVRTHFLFGMGPFNLEMGPTRLSRWSPWIMSTVPLVLILSAWPWFLHRQFNLIGTIGLGLALITYLINFTFIIRFSMQLPGTIHDHIQSFTGIGGCITGILSLIFSALAFMGITANILLPTPTPVMPTATPSAIPTSISKEASSAVPTEAPISPFTETPIVTPPPTATVTVTSTVTSIETPRLSLIVNAPYLDSLRKGPHLRHPYPFPACLNGKEATDKKVIILNRDSSSTWFFVRMEQVEGCEGWLHKNWMELASVNITEVPVAEITPTNPPPFTPTRERPDGPTCVPHDPNC